MTEATNHFQALVKEGSADSRLTYAINHIETAEDKAAILAIGIAALGDEGLTRPPRLRMKAAETLMKWGDPNHNDRNILIEAWEADCLDWAAEGIASRKTVISKLNEHTKDNGDPATASPFAEAAAAIGWKLTRDNAVTKAKALVRTLLPDRFAGRLDQPSDTM